MAKTTLREDFKTAFRETKQFLQKNVRQPKPVSGYPPLAFAVYPVPPPVRRKRVKRRQQKIIRKGKQIIIQT